MPRTIYRHPTHFPADLQTVIIRGPDLLSLGDLRRPRSAAHHPSDLLGRLGLGIGSVSRLYYTTAQTLPSR